MLSVPLGRAVWRRREKGEQTLSFVDRCRVFVVAAVSEGERRRGWEVRGSVWLVGFGVDWLACIDSCEGAFC